MLKRLAAVLLISVMLAGCGGSGSQPAAKDPAPAPSTGGSSTPAPKKPVTLEFPTWQAEDPAFGPFFKALIAEYQTENPHVTINLTQLPYASYVDTLTTRFAASTPPDIVHLPTRFVPQFADQGWLAPLDELLKETDVPSTWTPLQREMIWDGKSYGVLLLGYGYVLYYNEKLLKDAGFDAPPKNVEELLAVAKAATKDGRFGYGMVTADHPNIYPEVSQFVAGENLTWEKDGKYTFTQPEVVKAVDLYREMLKYSPKGTMSEQKRQLFYDGKIAMITDGPWVLAAAQKSAEGPNLKVTRVPFKYVPGSVSNSIHMPANLPPEKQEAVWGLIKLLTTPKWQQNYATMTKNPAPRNGALSAEAIKADPVMDLFMKASAAAVSINPTADNLKANMTEFSKIISSHMMKLQTTNAPTAEVLSNLEKELSAKVKP